MERLGVPPEYQTRRVYGAQGVDWQERVNFDRLRKSRLARAQRKMKEHDLDALLLFRGDNIRYMTGIYDQVWRSLIFMRYAIVPQNGDPYMFETIGDLDCVRMHAPWLQSRLKPAMVWRWAGPAEEPMLQKFVSQVKATLSDEGIGPKARIGVDMLDPSSTAALTKGGVNFVDATKAIMETRLIKMQDELEILKQTCAIVDGAYYNLRNNWVRPGVTEREVASKVAGYFYEQKCEVSGPGGLCVATGGNTNPYWRTHSDKIIRRGDTICIDLIPQYNGYLADFARCWVVGDKPTEEQKAVYRACYKALKTSEDVIKPKATTAEVAARWPTDVDEREGTVSLLNGGHSIGMSLYEGFYISRAYSLKFPMTIEKNMYLAIETYTFNPGKSNVAARLEDNGVVTDSGYKCFSMFPYEEEMLRE